jgi:uncharacterized protein YaeQ
VALTSTIYTLDVDLAHVDRGVYEAFSLRIARHPSESEDYLVARIIAYCCEYAPGIAFSAGGLSDPDEPPIAVRDLTSALQVWIDIGTPSADRLHRASKAAPRVAVYLHRDASQWLEGIAGARIHRAEQLELYAIDRALVAALAAKLARRMSASVTISDAEVFVALADATASGPLTRLRLPPARP